MMRVRSAPRSAAVVMYPAARGVRPERRGIEPRARAVPLDGPLDRVGPLGFRLNSASLVDRPEHQAPLVPAESSHSRPEATGQMDRPAGMAFSTPCPS